MGRKREKISVTLYAKRDLLTTGWEEVVTQKVLICCIIEEEDDMGNTEKEQDKYLCHNPFKWPHSVLLFHHISSIPDRPHSSSYLTPPKSTLTQACSTPFPCSWHLIPCCFIYRRKKKKHYLTSLVWQKKFLILMLYSGSPNSWSILDFWKSAVEICRGEPASTNWKNKFYQGQVGLVIPNCLGAFWKNLWQKNFTFICF